MIILPLNGVYNEFLMVPFLNTHDKLKNSKPGLKFGSETEIPRW